MIILLSDPRRKLEAWPSETVPAQAIPEEKCRYSMPVVRHRATSGVALETRHAARQSADFDRTVTMHAPAKVFSTVSTFSGDRGPAAGKPRERSRERVRPLDLCPYPALRLRRSD